MGKPVDVAVPKKQNPPEAGFVAIVEQINLSQ
jgi:hypothetical protein